MSIGLGQEPVTDSQVQGADSMAAALDEKGMTAHRDFWCSFKSVCAAIDHMGRDNGPGRKAEAIRKLVMWE